MQKEIITDIAIYKKNKMKKLKAVLFHKELQENNLIINAKIIVIVIMIVKKKKIQLLNKNKII